MAGLVSLQCSIRLSHQGLLWAVHVDQAGEITGIRAAPPHVGFEPFLTNAAQIMNGQNLA